MRQWAPSRQQAAQHADTRIPVCSLLLLCVCKDKKKHKKEKSHKKHKERKKDRDKGDGDDARVKAAKEFLKQQLAGEQACSHSAKRGCGSRNVGSE